MAYKTGVLGFPRIGKNRELKFAVEKYFKNELSINDLEKTAAELRKYGWDKQKENKMDFIPSNDFSFYDNVLDTAFLFNALPARYMNLNLSQAEKYFAAAHGYQGEAGDVKALPMKKWFNTNYHYIVPELCDQTKISLAENNKVCREYSEAKAQGFDTIPVITGPFTFLKLASYTGKKSAADFAEEFTAAYIQLAKELEAKGCQWIALAEPYLVMDLISQDKDLFDKIYKKLIQTVKAECKIKVCLQTFFGDVRDIYSQLDQYGFDGIALDFVEGKENLKLLASGFPKDTLLFAGIVNGKNIWRCNYESKNKLLEEIKKYVKEENIVITSSCSLLH
nr:5-methyltetrahydropteroyltriglutamate--homocysteine S-methyltransferase [Treponema sp.]